MDGIEPPIISVQFRRNFSPATCPSNPYGTALSAPRKHPALAMICSHSWVAVFQFLVCIPLAVPAALAGNPAVSPMELPRNLWDGWLCYLGYNSVVVGEHPDDCWPDGPLYVTLYLIVNINYNILITLVSARETGTTDVVDL